MEVIQRAWHFITRKKMKTLIMTVILILISSVIRLCWKIMLDIIWGHREGLVR